MLMKARSTVALVVAATLTASCATVPPQAASPAGARPVASNQATPDDLLANTVYSKLNANPTYYFRHVDVRLHDGVAYLTGYVWSTDALYAAQRIARSVPGVTGVVTTDLELERNGRNSGVSR